MLELTTISRDHLTHLYREHMIDGFLRMRRQEVEHDIRQLGADSYDLLLPETHTLPVIVDLNERIIGLVYGRYKLEEGGFVSRGALVATDRRLILINRKPLFLRCDEIEYRAIASVTYTWLGPSGAVVLHIAGGEIHLRTFNRACAIKFTEAVQERLRKETDPKFQRLVDDNAY